MNSTELKEVRKDLGLSQEKMAEYAGISYRQYQYIESGKCKISGEAQSNILLRCGILNIKKEIKSFLDNPNKTNK